MAARVVVLAVTGLLLTVAYREAVVAEPARSRAHAGLVREVKQARARTDDLQARGEVLRGRVELARSEALGGSSAALRGIREQEAVTGFAPVAGDGVTVVLSDAPAPIDPTTGKPAQGEVSRVLDVDVQAVVNGLWAAGAEAVAVNGQRLTATSAIRTAGSAILVDFRPVTGPYRVTAIGSGGLRGRFESSSTSESLRSMAARYGLGLSIEDSSDLRLPGAADVVLRFATPVPSLSASPTRSPGWDATDRGGVTPAPPTATKGHR